MFLFQKDKISHLSWGRRNNPSSSLMLVKSSLLFHLILSLSFVLPYEMLSCFSSSLCYQCLHHFTCFTLLSVFSPNHNTNDTQKNDNLCAPLPTSLCFIPLSVVYHLLPCECLFYIFLKHPISPKSFVG